MEDNSSIGGESVHWSKWALLAILLLSTALSLHQLAANSLRVDEILTAEYVQQPSLADMMAALTGFAGRPLHFLIVRLTASLGGNEFWLRLPSVAFGLLSLVVTYKVGQILFGRKEGLVAAFLLAISPLHIRYCQEARCYTLFVLLSILSLYCLLMYWRSEHWYWGMGFALASILNTYTHYFSAVVLTAEGIIAAIILARSHALLSKASALERECLLERQKRFVVMLATSLLAVALAFLPSLPHLRAFLGRFSGGAEATRLEPSVQFFANLLYQLSIGIQMQKQLSSSVWLLGILFFVGLLAGGLRAGYKAISWILVWLFLPLAILISVPSRHFFSVRYIIFVLPIFLLVVSKGVSSLADGCAWLAGRLPALQRGQTPRIVGRGFLAVMIAVVILLYAPALIQTSYTRSKPPWREVSAFLDRHVGPNDVVIVEPPYEKMCLDYYGHLPYVFDNRSSVQIEQIAERHPTIWYVLHGQPDAARAVDRWISEQRNVTLIFGGFNPAGAVSDIRISVNKRAWQEPDEALDEGLGLIDDALAQSQGAIRGDLTLARLYADCDHPLEAVEHYRNAAVTAPAMLAATIYEELGKFQWAQGDLTGSVASFRQALLIRPHSPWIWSQLGQVYMAQGLPTQAEAALQQAVEEQPENAWFHHLLGNAYLTQEQWDSAVASYENALIYGESSGIYRGLALAYEGEGQTELAIATWERLLVMEPHPKLQREAEQHLTELGREGQ